MLYHRRGLRASPHPACLPLISNYPSVSFCQRGRRGTTHSVITTKYCCVCVCVYQDLGKGLHHNIMTCSKSKRAESGTCKQMQIRCSCKGNCAHVCMAPLLKSCHAYNVSLRCREGCILQCNTNSQLLLRFSGGLQIYLLTICTGNEL